MVKEHIKKALIRALAELSIEVEPLIEHPADEKHGDYSSNVALVVSKKLRQNPMVVAAQIAENGRWKMLASRLSSTQARSGGDGKYLDRVEVAPPGFLNFWLSKEYLVRRLQNIVEKKESNSPSQTWRGKKIMVEFTDPNPFKEFHVGHLYSNAVGEAICRLLESQDAVVKRANYQGDIGPHVAKAIFGMRQKLKTQNSKLKSTTQNAKVDEELRETEGRPLRERLRFLGEAYAMGSNAYEEDQQAKEEMIALNKKIYEKDPEIMPLYEKGRAWSLEHFETIYKRLGTKFDYYYFESKAGEIGLNLVKQYLEKGIFVKSDGAVIFRGETYGLHNRVFINSLGLPTYEAKELGLAPTKYQDFRYDQSIIVTGNEINAYFRVLIEALKRVNPDLGEKTTHLSHGMVRLPSGKMSSRTGQVITGEWLLDEAKRRIQERFSQMIEGTADMVAVGAVKYALLRSTIGKDVIFDIDESISFEGNSGPYLQYTFARTQSVLKKSKIKNQNAKIQGKMQKLKLNEEELGLLRSLHRFPEVVEEAAEAFAPNTLATYLFDLAQKFNLFYERHPILIPGVSSNNHPRGEDETTPQESMRDFRLALTQAVGHVLKDGLRLLGIEAPERM